MKSIKENVTNKIDTVSKLENAMINYCKKTIEPKADDSGINIYDKYDPCFTDACFTSENFEFDLTQKYRKKNVFQKWSLDSEICKYHSFENASNNIEISCQKFEDFGKMGDDSYNYATLNLTAKKDYVDNQDKVYNLPMKCKKKIMDK